MDDSPYISQISNKEELMMENETLNASDFGQFLLNNHLIPQVENHFLLIGYEYFSRKRITGLIIRGLSQ